MPLHAACVMSVGDMGRLDDVVHCIDEDQLNALEQMFGDFLKVLLIPFRKDDGRELGSFCREDFLLQTSDRQAAVHAR